MINKIYKPSAEQIALIEMANQLSKPLLISGKPGTGKTYLAHSYAAQNENQFTKVFQFHTKSTSIYTDLLYTYDAIEHFRDTQLKNSSDKKIEHFIRLESLGKAFVLAKGLNSEEFQSPQWQTIIQNSFSEADKKTSKCIVLIDEIDKSPRDFPNDLLNELDNFEFRIHEIDQTISFKNELDKLKDTEEKGKLKNVIILITSNDEKNLPDAFLRRCLFYYIEFPDNLKLNAIVKEKLESSGIVLKDYSKDDKWLENQLSIFHKIRNDERIEKKPSTAECIEWLAWRSTREDNIANQKQSLSIILKKEEDKKTAIEILNLK